MSKRSNFKRRKNDAYFTPYSPAVPALLPYLPKKTDFIEPCAGNGQLIDHLTKHGHRCVGAYDIDPQRRDITKADSRVIKNHEHCVYITNPPWTREILHPMIENLSSQRATWLLFDADWKYTIQEKMAKRIGCKTVPELMEYCAKVVAVGRVSWEENGVSGKDNTAWYLFVPYKTQTIFEPRPL